MRTFALRESFQLKHHNFRDFVEFQLLGNIPVLLTLVAVPLIVATQSLLLLITLEAASQRYALRLCILLAHLLKIALKFLVRAFLIFKNDGQRKVTLVLNLV